MGRKKLHCKSALMGMRIDPQLKYLGELAARVERRSLTSFMEWALEHALARTYVNTVKGPDEVRRQTLQTLQHELWDPDPIARVQKLNNICPDLMTYEERQLIAP